MKDYSKLKIKIGNHRVVTLPELYGEYDKTHQLQAELSFEKKIEALVNMQKLAVSWGKRQDIIVWKIEDLDY